VKTSRIALDAPIKINLALHIVGQAANGYHLLQTLVTFAAGGDRVAIVASERDEVNLDGEYGHDLSTGSDNLIVKARDLLRSAVAEAAVGGAAFPVMLSLTKNLPPASGLGGGSADAAATLLGLSRLWQVEKEHKLLYDLSRRLGADVPMCLHALQHHQMLMATGIGDKIVPLADFPALDMVIVNPGKNLSTAAVFEAFALSAKAYPRAEGSNGCFILPPDSLTSVEKLVASLKTLRNDLSYPAWCLMPEITLLIEKLENSGALLARMSGSGASCFGIYANPFKAQQAAALLKAQHPDYFVQTVRSFGS